MTIAEESSDFPMLTKPVHDGGVGFGMKWMMGWMHDTLKYFKEDPINRKYHHNKLTFGSMYVYNENYMMPLSHDEVVHGKASLIYKMPGDEWQKFANLRALYTYMFTHPGAKLLFMGNEFAQTNEWNFTRSLDWHLLNYPVHKGMQEFVKDLNHLYTSEPALYENNFKPEGMEWVEANDGNNSIYIYLRKGKKEDDVLMTVLNLTPRVFDYKIGVDEGTNWEVILNSDDEKYAGSGVAAEIVDEEDDEWMYRPNAIILKLPPLSGVILKQKKAAKKKVSQPKAVVAKPKTTKKIASEEEVIQKKVAAKKTVAKTSAKITEASKPKTARKKPEVTLNQPKEDIASLTLKDKPKQVRKTTVKKEVSEKVAAPKTSRLKKATDEAAAEMKKIVESPKKEVRSRKKN